MTAHCTAAASGGLLQSSPLSGDLAKQGHWASGGLHRVPQKEESEVTLTLSINTTNHQLQRGDPTDPTKVLQLQHSCQQQPRCSSVIVAVIDCAKLGRD